MDTTRFRKLAPALLAAAALACEEDGRGRAPAQPIAFSHALHAGEREVPCLYCHSGALRSRHAGVPATGTCGNCHLQLAARPQTEPVREAVAGAQPVRWNRVHRLPDHAWFDHAAHETAGVECASCHGEVERMARVEQVSTLSMGWCLDCHREPPAGLREATTDCASCHR